MVVEDIRKWLDDLIENYNQRQALMKFNNHIETCFESSYIQLHTGIKIITDVIGEELKEDREWSDKYIKYSFIYKGIEFMQLNEKETEKYAKCG